MTCQRSPPIDYSKCSRLLRRELNRRGIKPRSQTRGSQDLARYRNRPVEFCREVLGVEPWEKQVEILAAVAREPRVTVRSCNGAGKTLCAAWCVLWFLTTRPGSIVVTTAPTGHQVKNLLWRRLRGAYFASRIPLPGRCQTVQLDCAPEWYAIGISTDQEVNFQGPHSPHGVLMVGDEASGLAPWMFQAMEGSLTEAESKMLLIGNPNDAAGAFYESHKSWDARQKFHISAFDVPPHVLRPTWKEEMAADYGTESPVYAVRVLGNFPDQGDDRLFPLSRVEAAINRALPSEPKQPVVAGLDVAYTGSDESVCFVRQGGRVLASAAWRGYDTLESAGRATPLMKEYDVKTLNVDAIGFGAGTYDQLRQNFAGTATRVYGLHGGQKASDPEKFFNRRSELFWGLAERFRDGDIQIPNDPLLVDQLVTLRFVYTPRGQVKVVGKDELKKERPANAKWHSTDRADALMLAFAGAGNRWLPASLAGEAVDTTPRGIG